MALPRLGGLAISPDGARLVTAVSEPGPDGKKYQSALWEIDPSGQRIVGNGREQRHPGRTVGRLRRRGQLGQPRAGAGRGGRGEQRKGDGGLNAAAAADHGPTVRLARAACGPPGKSCR